MSRRQASGVCFGAALAALLALIASSGFWRAGPYTLYLARHHADWVVILASARDATPQDWVRWWVGSWIERGTPYYRPLSSTLMGLEWEASGDRVLGFCGVGWVLHALNTLLLFLLAWRVLPGSPRRRLWLAGVAAAVFTLPTRGNMGVAAADVKWWPA